MLRSKAGTLTATSAVLSQYGYVYGMSKKHCRCREGQERQLVPTRQLTPRSHTRCGAPSARVGLAFCSPLPQTRTFTSEKQARRHN